MTNDSGRGIEEIEFSRSTPRREVQKYKLPGRYNKRHRVRGRDVEEVASTLKNDFSSRFFIPIVPLNYSRLSTSITRYSIFGFFENSRRGSHAKKSAGHDFIKLSSLDSSLVESSAPLCFTGPDSTCKKRQQRVEGGWVQVSEDGGISFRVSHLLRRIVRTRGSRVLPLIECKREPLEKSGGGHFRAQGDA